VKIACICLARIGSKRLPNKLLRIFSGLPLIEWTLAAMNQLSLGSYIYTDSEDIKKIAVNYNVNVRPKILENDEGVHHTSDEIKEYNKEIGADIIVLLQGTSPLRNVNALKNYIKAFLGSGKDVGFTVNELDKYVYDENGNIINCDNRGYNKAISNYIENGSFYIFKKEQLDKPHITDGEKIMFVDKYDVDIDYEDDLKKAEILLKGGYYAD
jgi:CMP-N,N'-diacetyllegionaminic acid synthase